MWFRFSGVFMAVFTKGGDKGNGEAFDGILDTDMYREWDCKMHQMRNDLLMGHQRGLLC